MCESCNTSRMLANAGIKRTKNRRLVLDIISEAGQPICAHEIEDTASRRVPGAPMNRVTVYRILDLLAEKGLVNRLVTPDRLERYCLAGNENHPLHAHFFCESCCRVQCMDPWLTRIQRVDPAQSQYGRVVSVQILYDGVCGDCLGK